jgi:hypothetical protein
MILIPEDGQGTASLFDAPQTLFDFPARRHWTQPPPRVVGRQSVPVEPHPTSGPWKGAFVLTVDLSWLNADQEVAIEGQVRVDEEGANQSLFTVRLDRSQGRLTWQSRPLYSRYGCAFVATQVAGTGRAVLPWWVVQLDA